MKKFFLLSLLALSSGALSAMDETPSHELEEVPQNNQLVQLQVSKLNEGAAQGLNLLADLRLTQVALDPKTPSTLAQKQHQFAGALCAFLENVKKVDPAPTELGAVLLSFDNEKLTKLRKQLRQISKESEVSTEKSHSKGITKHKGIGTSPLLKYVMTFVGGAGTLWALQKCGVPPFN